MCKENVIESPRVVIATTIYNMAKTLYRTYLSIISQTYDNLYWLIIDNGSTDNIDNIIAKMISEGKIHIVYEKKEHEVRAAAINRAYDLAEGDYICFIDADDELEKFAIEKFVEIYQNFPSDFAKKCWCVTANCVDATTGDVVGRTFPTNIHKKNRIKVLLDCSLGEKIGMQNLLLIADNRLPIWEGVDYIPESILWLKLTYKYYNYYCNFNGRIYHHDNENSYTVQPMTTQRAYSFYRASEYMINDFATENKYPIKYKLKEVLRLGYYGKIARLKRTNIIRNLKLKTDKTLYIFLYPFILVICKIKIPGKE